MANEIAQEFTIVTSITIAAAITPNIVIILISPANFVTIGTITARKEDRNS